MLKCDSVNDSIVTGHYPRQNHKANMTSETLASALVNSFRSGAVVHPIVGELPSDMSSAERLQDAVIAELGAVGAWKLGATVVEVRKTLGSTACFLWCRPLRARVFVTGSPPSRSPAAIRR